MSFFLTILIRSGNHQLIVLGLPIAKLRVKKGGFQMEKIGKQKTALLILDVQNDIVHENGKYKDFGSPAHAKKQNIFQNIRKVLDKARRIWMNL